MAFNREPFKRPPFRAKNRRHAQLQGWCVHCGTAISPCECAGCHPAAIIGRKREVTIVAPWMGDDIEHLDRELRWMHEGCIKRRFIALSSTNSPIMPVKLPPAQRPACVINLTTSVVPAPRGPRVEPITWRKMADN